MNSRAFTLSIVISLIAIFMVHSYIEGKEGQFKENYGNQVPVVVASKEIKEMEIIDERKLQIVNVPKKYRMPGAFVSVEELSNTIAAVPIQEGEQITKPRITYPGSKTGLSRQISVGKRAFSVRINDARAISRLLKPGDRVDVITLMDYQSGRKEGMKVKTVLQDVYVLATGMRVTKEIPMAKLKVNKEIKKLDLNTYTNFNTVTLELSPFEVQKMIFLIQAGSGIFLSLRNNDDKLKESIGGTDLFDVLGEDALEAKQYFLKQAQRQNQRR